MGAGGNYGWNLREGMNCFDTRDPNNPPADCPRESITGAPLIDPVVTYRNAAQADGIGRAVIGGHIYRGSALPAFAGKYIFGDWGASYNQDGTLFVATPRDEGLWDYEPITITNRREGVLGAYLLSIGADAAGELYALTTAQIGPSRNTGQVWRLVPPG